jgi:hypothetical protein
MWNNKTAKNLRAALERIYEKIPVYYASGNHKLYFAYTDDARRIDRALTRLTIGRVR